MFCMRVVSKRATGWFDGRTPRFIGLSVRDSRARERMLSSVCVIHLNCAEPGIWCLSVHMGSLSLVEYISMALAYGVGNGSDPTHHGQGSPNVYACPPGPCEEQRRKSTMPPQKARLEIVPRCPGPVRSDPVVVLPVAS